MSKVIHRADITGVILAGGQGRRFDGQDKGLIRLEDKLLIEHIIAQCGPQCGALVINANRNTEQYSSYGLAVITDESTGFQGPLAGISAAMQASKSPWIITVPCDAPWVSKRYVERMRQACDDAQATIAVARDASRLQPVYALIDVALQESLSQYLESGERKIDRWYAQQKMVQVDFSDDAKMFDNFNTPEQLQAYRSTPKPVSDTDS